MTEKALNGLYDRLVLIEKELLQLRIIAIDLLSVRQCDEFATFAKNAEIEYDRQNIRFSDQRKANIEQDVLAALTRCQYHLSRRQSLPQLPEFPSEAELQQAHQKWFQDQLSAQAAAWGQPLSTPPGYGGTLSPAVLSTTMNADPPLKPVPKK